MTEKTSSRRLPTVVHALATEQDLIATRVQLTALGIGHETVRRRTQQGIWRELGPRVLALHSGELTSRQRDWIGVLHAGPGSALSLSSAAACGGLRGHLTSDVHVAVAHGSEVTDLDQPGLRIRVHQTRHATSDIAAGRSPARHTLSRAVVEMASAAATEDRCRGPIAAAVQQRLVRPSALEAFLATRPTLPRRRLIRETIADVTGGAHSLPELDYARLLRRAGLPEPTRQRKVCRSNGVWYLDNDFDEWMVTVEINGMQHHELLASEADNRRREGLQIRGRLVVDISSYAVRHRPAEVVQRTTDALRSRGWRPTSVQVDRLRGSTAPLQPVHFEQTG